MNFCAKSQILQIKEGSLPSSRFSTKTAAALLYFAVIFAKSRPIENYFNDRPPDGFLFGPSSAIVSRLPAAPTIACSPSSLATSWLAADAPYKQICAPSSNCDFRFSECAVTRGYATCLEAVLPRQFAQCKLPAARKN